MNDHESYMRRAIERAANVPDFPFGALIVDGDSGKILSEGWNKSSINPTFHGEIDAINQLGTVKPEEINALGFMLGDKKAGRFKMEIERIKVERAAK